MHGHDHHDADCGWEGGWGGHHGHHHSCCCYSHGHHGGCCCCCCCYTHGHHSRWGHKEGHHEGCCEVGSGMGFRRRFIGREEKIAKLESYLADLRAEAKAVEEKIAELRRGA